MATPQDVLPVTGPPPRLLGNPAATTDRATADRVTADPQPGDGGRLPDALTDAPIVARRRPWQLVSAAVALLLLAMAVNSVVRNKAFQWGWWPTTSPPPPSSTACCSRCG